MRRRMLAGLLGLVLLAASMVAVRPAKAVPTTSTTGGVLLLLDTSGSMSDRDTNGRIKIEGAKAGIVSLLDALPSHARVGLMTFPGDGNCGEPTLVRALQPLSSGNLGAVVSGLASPNGNTPTALALRKAAELVRADGGHGTIVLVSDGLANCNVPPCPVAEEIVRSGIGLTVNTVGFAIDDAGRKELQCIADATGGQYVDVENGEDLGGEIAKQMTPALQIWANFPSAEVPVSAVGAPVSAKVVNTSGVTATNVRVTLTPVSSDAFLGILRPVVALGNLAKGETRQIDWTIPVSPELLDRRIELKITAQGSNTPLFSQQGVVQFGSGTGSLLGTSSQFAGVERVAVLGDSFSAGDGAHQDLSQYQDLRLSGTDCRVSDSTYADVLFPGKVHNFACTGATTADVTFSYQNGQVTPQVAQLKAAMRRGEEFDLVFLTVGGNDIGFADIATNCIAHTILGPASRGASNLPFLNPCAADPDSVLYGIQQDLMDAQGPILQDTYQQVATAFSSLGKDVPSIIVSPYPLMFPSDVGLRWSCGVIDLAVTQDQMADFTDFQRKLNRLVEESVNRTRERDGIPVYFAGSVENALQPDHTMCGSKSWIVTPRLDNVGPAPIHWDTPFHPSIEGHQAWALALARWSESPDLQLDKGTKPAGERTLPWVFRLSPRGSIDGSRATNLVASGEADLAVTGLAPGSPLIAVVHSNPYPLGTATADANGQVKLRVHLDGGIIQPGIHELHLGVVEADGTNHIRVSTLYVTRAIPYCVWVLLALGMGLTLAGIVWRLRGKRAAPAEAPAA